VGRSRGGPANPRRCGPADAKQEALKRCVQADPLVQERGPRFPGAQIVAVRQPEPGKGAAGSRGRT